MYSPTKTPDQNRPQQSGADPHNQTASTATPDKPLKPAPEHYGEVQSLFDWLNRSFYKGTLDAPMFTFVRALRSFGVYVPGAWDHRSGTSRPEFRLSPDAFRDADLQDKAIGLLRLMETLRQGKTSRTNYADRDYAAGMKAHGLKTQSLDNPDKETGERITVSVIPGGKFEKLIGKKQESDTGFAWTAAAPESEQAPEEDTQGADKPKSKRKAATRIKYVCPYEGCGENLRGRALLRPLCQGHPETFPEPHPPAAMVPED